MRAKELIKMLQLEPHPEGGFYKRIYTATDLVIAPNRFAGNGHKRAAATIIYYLLQSNNFSAFHRIKSDETWSFTEGSPILLHMINPNTEEYSMIRLGSFNEGATSIFTVPHGIWFAAEVDKSNSYSLANCFVSPGFTFSDFELAERNKLIKEYPQHSSIIEHFTRIDSPRIYE